MENSLIDVSQRFKDYGEEHCWQYEIRLRNLEEDISLAGLKPGDAESLRISDFKFEYVDKSEKDKCAEISDFIKKHEWLGKLPNRPTQRFTARLKEGNVLAGVIIMAVPNTFSHLLGKENIGIEKLISRGACISWSPKSLGSWLVTKSIKWMVQNTDFRYFTAYSDPEAKELGTIYQACNFIYLGKGSGVAKQYFDPENPKQGWFSGREFRKKSKYYRYAKEVGISKEQWALWMKKYSPDWTLVPPAVKTMVKERERVYRDSCHVREVVSKHKYCYILGKTKAETKSLKKLFIEKNPDKINLPYPKNRGE